MDSRHSRVGAQCLCLAILQKGTVAQLGSRICDTSISLGSLFEMQTQLLIARNLQYLDSNSFDRLDEASREIERMLTGLMRSLRNKPSK